MPDRTLQARRAIDMLVGRVGSLDEDGVRRTAALLDELRRTVIVSIADAHSDYQRGAIADVLRAINVAVSDFRLRYSLELAALQAKGFNLGTLMVDVPLTSAASHLVLPTTLGSDLLEVVQGYSADLVTGIAESVRQAITSEVRLGVLASRPPFEVMQRIGSSIDAGRFANIAARAETVTRTEIGRIVSLASYRRFKQAQERVPHLQQQWLATLDDRTRPAHRKAHEQVRDIGEPFEVGGEDLRFPGDPNGSAEETINCRCRVVPYAANWTDVIDPLANMPAPAWLRERLAAAEVVL